MSKLTRRQRGVQWLIMCETRTKTNKIERIVDSIFSFGNKVLFFFCGKKLVVHLDLVFCVYSEGGNG